jgi:hypothetical protein
MGVHVTLNSSQSRPVILKVVIPYCNAMKRDKEHSCLFDLLSRSRNLMSTEAYTDQVHLVLCSTSTYVALHVHKLLKFIIGTNDKFVYASAVAVRNAYSISCEA